MEEREQWDFTWTSPEGAGTGSDCPLQQGTAGSSVAVGSGLGQASTLMEAEHGFSWSSRRGPLKQMRGEVIQSSLSLPVHWVTVVVDSVALSNHHIRFPRRRAHHPLGRVSPYHESSVLQ